MDIKNMKVEYIEICIKANDKIYPKRIFINKECKADYTDLFVLIDNSNINGEIVNLYEQIVTREK